MKKIIFTKGVIFVKKFVALLLVPFIFVGCSNDSEDKPASNYYDSYSESALVTEAETQDLQKLDKAEAEKIDAEIWEKDMSLVKYHNYLMNVMGQYADGEVYKSDVYELCDKLENLCMTASKVFPESENKDVKEYVDNGKTFCSYVQTEANLLKKYLETENPSDFSKLQQQVNTTKEGIVTLSNNRGVFLRKYGFTEEEIKAKAEEVDNQIQE